MRALIVHKPSGRDAGQLRRLVRYCLRPGPKSQERERVIGVVDGLDLMRGGAPNHDGLLLPTSAEFLAAQLCDDIPEGRRLYRHVVVSLAAEEGEDLSLIPLKDQIRLLDEVVRLYAAIHAPGYRFVSIDHGDHRGEDERGLHAHVIFRNADASGKALDWSRQDLQAQQSMTWAEGLGVSPTRGTGIKRAPGTRMPYPKAAALDAIMLGKLTETEIYELILQGRLGAGRVDKEGHLKSVVLDGRRIRLSTARQLAKRERGMAVPGEVGRKQAGLALGNNLIRRMATKPPPPTPDHATGRRGHSRFLGLGFEPGRADLGGTRRQKNRRDRRAIRGAGRRVNQALKSLAFRIMAPLERL